MAAAEFDWLVPADHPAFAGHFPGRPIVPGVVLLDRAIHFAEILLGRPGLAWQVGNAKFFSPVGPGETLTFAPLAFCCSANVSVFPVGPGETLTFALQQKASGAIAFAVQAAGRDIAAGSLTPPAP